MASISPGARLGPYEILAPLGAGGMGEVYRARDPRIGREVAIKILPAAFAADADRLRRFEQEVQAAGALNHPNILTIYDVGTHEGAPYIVSELLEGETLRERLTGGPLPQRKAIDYAAAVARGLAAAHEKGIVHRDLKPENLFLTSDGRVKILDFGLAKLIHPEMTANTATNAPTVAAETEPGVVLGTVGYMSPEQARGKSADARSDIFSLGTVLYEMLAGKAAFRRETGADSMTAILKEDPPPLDSPGLDRIVRRCLEKNPPERFQSASDLAFALESVSGISTAGGVATPATAPPSSFLRRRAVLAALVAAMILLPALTFWVGQKLGFRQGAATPVFHQLTFRRGGIQSARFGPDGQTVIYSASWDGKPFQLFSTRAGSPESRSLDLPSSTMLSISPSGEMAIALGVNLEDWWFGNGMLARVPLVGGAPREILEHVGAADWSSDGRLAVVQNLGARWRIEFPIGKVIYDTSHGISHLRLSPKADLIAFIDHPLPPDDAGFVAVVDLAGHERLLTPRYNSAQGLAWTPSGGEIWYTAAASGIDADLHAVKPDGSSPPRVVLRVPGRLSLHDIARDGRVLLGRESWRVGAAGIFPGDSKERDISWLDLSFATHLSVDGRTALLSEQGEGGGPHYSVYVRKTDGSPAVRLGDGYGAALSPDGKWVLTFLGAQFLLLPTGAGETRTLPRGPIESYSFEGAWFPDSKRVVFLGSERGHGLRLYVQDIAGGDPRPISPEGTTALSALSISPDGELVVAADASRKAWLYPVGGGQPREVPALAPGDVPIRMSADGRALYIHKMGGMPDIYKVDLTSGRRELWKQIRPADPAGWVPFFFVSVTPDGKYYAYTYARILSDLYLVEGLQ